MVETKMKENEKLAQEVLDIKIEIRREEMIKTLLNQKKSRVSDENIKAQLNTFKTSVNKELAAVEKQKLLVQKEIKDAELEVSTNIPAKVKRFEAQTVEIENKKSLITS